MNKKRYLLATVVGSIFVFLYEMLVHGHLLMPMYEETKELWRTQDDMAEYLSMAMGIQFLFVAILCFIFTRNYEEKGMDEGVRFGAMFGLLLGLMAFAPYVWMPISMTLAVAWAAVTFVELLLLGIIFSLTYKK
jgi:hypothetical protein